jgi:ribosomal RNA-processing protein 1
MWHSDRPLTQQRLATSLAALVSDLQPTLVLPFLKAFWTTMAREWSGIDVLRMDKFLFLVRQYVAAAWAYFARTGWEDAEPLREYLEMLGAGPLSPEDRKVPDGMRYHVLDIYVDELDRVDEPRSGKVPVEVLLGPLRRLEKESPTKSVRERARGALEDERLEDWEGGGVIDGEDGEKDREESGNGEWEGFDD